MKTNLLSGIVAIVSAVVLWLLIPSQVPPSRVATEYFDGSFMPKLMAIVMGLCGGICLLKSLVFKDYDTKSIVLEIEAKNCIYLGMVLVYGILATTVSFMLASLLFGLGSLLFLRCRNVRKYILVTIAIIGVGLIFRYGLNVRFGGIWGF